MKTLKKFITILLSDSIAFSIFIAKRLFSMFNFGNKKPILRILVYHSVSGKTFCKDTEESNVSLDAFTRQMNYLKLTRNVVKLSEGINELRTNKLSGNLVAITFDDGLRDVYDEAVKVLKDLNFNATFFISCDEAQSGKKDFMNWEMVRSLKSDGFDIGCHSYFHKPLTRLNQAELDNEIDRSKKKFNDEKVEADYFAYPYGFYGDFSEETEYALKKFGYTATLTNIMGDNTKGASLFGLKRTRISWRDNGFRFKMKLEGCYDWVDILKSRFFNGRD